MGCTARAGLAFKLKRLTREYGTNITGNIGKLTVDGMVPAMDVYYAFVRCHSYRMAIVKGLFHRRADFEDVCGFLKELIFAEVEVVPINYLIPRSHRSMYVYRH